MPNLVAWRTWGLLCGLYALALFHAQTFAHLPDDAYISFRVAKNFAEGAGWVFNPGEYVMGYSNFLWVLLLSVGQWLGVPPPTSAQVLGALCGLGILASVYIFMLRRYSDLLAAVVAAGMLVANPTFGFWLLGGLEGPLFGLLLLLGVVVALEIDGTPSGRGHLVVGVLFGLAAITRPEGVFYAVPVAAYLLWRQPTATRAKWVAALLGTTLIFYGLFTAWAAWYYGDPLPNPFYAKHHPLSWMLLERGVFIVKRFLDGYLWAPLVVVGLWAGITRLRRDASGWLPLSIVAAFLVFYVRIGGDLQVYYRMWFWVLPMLALLAGEAVAVFAVDRRRRLAGAVVAAALSAATLQHSFWGEERARTAEDEAFVRGAGSIGKIVAQRHPGATLAANNVGALAYHGQRLHVLDMLGLTDRHIAKAPGKTLGIPAHESHDGKYVLERQPQLIFFGMPWRFPRPLTLVRYLSLGGYPSDLDLRRNPELLAAYRLDHLVLPNGWYAPVLRRKDWVPEARNRR